MLTVRQAGVCSAFKRLRCMHKCGAAALAAGVPACLPTMHTPTPVALARASHPPPLQLVRVLPSGDDGCAVGPGAAARSVWAAVLRRSQPSPARAARFAGFAVCLGQRRRRRGGGSSCARQGGSWRRRGRPGCSCSRHRVAYATPWRHLFCTTGQALAAAAAARRRCCASTGAFVHLGDSAAGRRAAIPSRVQLPALPQPCGPGRRPGCQQALRRLPPGALRLCSMPAGRLECLAPAWMQGGCRRRRRAAASAAVGRLSAARFSACPPPIDVLMCCVPLAWFCMCNLQSDPMFGRRVQAEKLERSARGSTARGASLNCHSIACGSGSMSPPSASAAGSCTAAAARRRSCKIRAAASRAAACSAARCSAACLRRR